MNDDRNFKPIIKDGELYTGEKKSRRELSTEPPKSGKLGNIILSLLAIAIIVYGVDSMMNKKEVKEDESYPSITSNETSNQTPEPEKETIDTLKGYVILPGDYSINIFTSEDNNGLKTGLTSFSSNYVLAISSLKCNIFDKNKTIDGQEMDSKVKAIFGNINYTKGGFTVGNRVYTYNQETDKYYLQSTNGTTNNYIKYNYVETSEEENKVIINEYVAYTNATSSATLGNIKLPSKIDGTNIQTNYKSLKHYEYVFVKTNNDYVLTSITIK